MGKRCCINVAFGPGWWPRGQRRLGESFKRFSPETPFLTWTDQVPPGCPPHKKVQYAFKPFAFADAFSRGYTTVLWVDAAAVLHKDPTPLFDQIEREGHYLQDNQGWTTGQWCSDSALQPLKVTREELFQTPHLMASVMGLDLTNKRSMEFLTQWKDLAAEGTAFKGDWKNDRRQVSKDPRVLGHRHDQTVASVLTLRLGMKWTPLNEGVLIYSPHDVSVEPRVYFTSQGM